MITFVYAKTMENLRKRIRVKLVNNEKDYLKHVTKSTFISQKNFDKNFTAIHKIKQVSTFNKPIFAGVTILDLIKWLTYDFHYNFIKKKVDAELLFTDTDSLTYEIKSEDVCEYFFNTNICLTLAISEKALSFMIIKMKWVVGKMKDEYKGIAVNKFVGLK